MKKQNTPIQELIQEFNDLKIKSVLSVEYLDFMDGIIAALESRLPTERESLISMAENAYWDVIGSGVISATDKEEIRRDAENLFTQTFKTQDDE